MGKDISIILPSFNEEENIASTVSAVRAWMEERRIGGEIIVVNDGSRDGTGEVLRMLEREQNSLPLGGRVRERGSEESSSTPSPVSSPLGRGKLHIITHPQNLGYGAAVRSGCDAATTEWIGFMDSDGQFDPRDFDKLLPFVCATLSPVPSPTAVGEGGAGGSLPLGGRVRERGSMNSSTPSPVSSPQGRGEFTVVVGRRRKRADPFFRRLNAKLFGILSFLVLGVWVRDVNCAMKVFRREVWQRTRPVVTTGALFNAEFFFNLKRQGIPWKQVDVFHYPRRGGRQTGAKPRVIFRMFRELLLLWMK